jgi:hypothetical protein
MAVAWKLCYADGPPSQNRVPFTWSASFISGSFHINQVLVMMRLGLDSRDISGDALTEGNLSLC